MQSPLIALLRCISCLNCWTTQHSAGSILLAYRSALSQPPLPSQALPASEPDLVPVQDSFPLQADEAISAEPPHDVIPPPPPRNIPHPLTPLGAPNLLIPPPLPTSAPSAPVPHTPAPHAWRYCYPTQRTPGITCSTITTSTATTSSSSTDTTSTITTTTTTKRGIGAGACHGGCGSSWAAGGVAGGPGAGGRCSFEPTASARSIGSSRTGSSCAYSTRNTGSSSDGGSSRGSSSSRGDADRGPDSGRGSSSGSASGTRREAGGSSGAGRGGAGDRPPPVHPVPAGSHYDVLGVPRNAPLAAIKSEFRQRAKRLHPDTFAANHRTSPAPRTSRSPLPHADHEAHVAASASAFLRLAAAHEVLSNPEARREYDMRLAEAEAAAASSSSSSSGSGGSGRGHPTGRRRGAPTAAAHHATAAGGGGGGGGTAAEGPDAAAAAVGGTTDAIRHIDFRSWRYGVGEWMTRPRREPLVGRRAVLEYYLRKYSSEFESQLHAALVHAYLGPKLDLQPGELPRCFEGELRRTPGASEQLMHLVSGRSLLGVVRVKVPLQLPPPGTAATSSPLGLPDQVGPQQQHNTPPTPPRPLQQVAAAAAVSRNTAPAAPTISATTLPPPAGGPVATAIRPAAAEGEMAATAIHERQAVGHRDMETPVTMPTTTTTTTTTTTANTDTNVDVDAATLAEVLPPAVTDAGGINPLDTLDPAVVRGLSDEAIVQLAAASIARRDVGASGYVHLVPGYSRLRGLLELQGFYPDSAALQRHSVQISLVTAAEGAQAREEEGSLGAAWLRERWRRQEAAVAAGTRTSDVTGKDDSTGEDSRGGNRGGGERIITGCNWGKGDGSLGRVGTMRMAEETEERQTTAVYDERAVREVLPPAQLQGLLEAGREALEQEAIMAAAAAEASNASSSTSAPRNDPRTWRFGPDGADDVNGPPLTVLELRIGRELAAVAVHQPPPPPPPQPPSTTLATATAAAATAANVATAASAAAVDIIGEVRQRLRGGHAAEGGGGGDSGPGRARGNDSGGSGSSSNDGGSSTEAPRSDAALEGTMIPLFGPVVEGRVKVYVGGRLVAGVEGRHVYDAEGKRVALIVRGSFPGLRTIHFFDASTRRLRLTCRCVRANLLPSPTWLFPPREETHDVGGWYFEWGGYGRRGQHGWLDPCVYVFVSALVAAEQERVTAARRAAVGELVGGWGRAVRQVVAGWWGR